MRFESEEKIVDLLVMAADPSGPRASDLTRVIAPRGTCLSAVSWLCPVADLTVCGNAGLRVAPRTLPGSPSASSESWVPF